MKVSKTGLNLIKKYEGFRETAYKDPVGIWTIGYGTTKWLDGSKVRQGQTITHDQALGLLEVQVNQHASTISKYVKRPLTQSQFDALASFQYNLGANILAANKTLLTALNSGDWSTVTQQMLLYHKARVGGVLTPLNGLIKRRKEEVELFMSKSVEAPKPQFDAELDVATKFVQNMKISDGLNPHENITRGQVFKMIYRMRELLIK